MTKRPLALLGILLLSAGMLPGAVSADQPPTHRDPKTESGEFSVLNSPGYFPIAMDFVAALDAEDQSELLARLREADLPGDIMFMIDRSREVSDSLTPELDVADVSVAEASVFLDEDDLLAAQDRLEAAESSLDHAERLLGDLEAAINNVARRFRAFSSAIDSPLREARNRLQGPRNRHEEISARYGEARERLERNPGFVDTPVIPLELSIYVEGLDAGADQGGREFTGFRLSRNLYVPVVLAAVACLAVALASTWRRRRDLPGIGMTTEGGQAGASSQAGMAAIARDVPATGMGTDQDTPQGRIISAYQRGARVLESRFAVIFQPHFTLRVFLRSLGSRTTAFLELTGLAERALYSPATAGEGDVRRAEQLADRVTEET